VKKFAGTDGPCGVGAVNGPRSSVAVAVCWCAGFGTCVRPCALRDHTHVFVHVERGKTEECDRGDLMECRL
jgi:hypothetical protein